MSEKTSESSGLHPSSVEVAEDLKRMHDRTDIQKLGEIAKDYRGKISPDGWRSSLTWFLLVMTGALVDEYGNMSPEQQAAFFDLLSSKLSILMTLPGAKLAFEAWRSDR